MSAEELGAFIHSTKVPSRSGSLVPSIDLPPAEIDHSDTQAPRAAKALPLGYALGGITRPDRDRAARNRSPRADSCLKTSGEIPPLRCVVHHGGVRVTASPVEAVYREQGSRLWRALLAYSADPDVASDALAEAFAQVLAHEGEVRDVAAWVWSAAFRIAAGVLKERQRVGDPVPEVSYQMPEPHHDVLAALRQLSPNQRLVVLLHDYADRPASEIARTMQIARATVYVHLSQGRRRLRGALEDHDA